MPAYVAYNTRVYDVISSLLWKNGRHQALYIADMDLSLKLEQAPYDETLLERSLFVEMFIDDVEAEIDS